MMLVEPRVGLVTGVGVTDTGSSTDRAPAPQASVTCWSVHACAGAPSLPATARPSVSAITVPRGGDVLRPDQWLLSILDLIFIVLIIYRDSDIPCRGMDEIMTSSIY
jgi:hypothetical protein